MAMARHLLLLLVVSHLLPSCAPAPFNPLGDLIAKPEDKAASYYSSPVTHAPPIRPDHNDDDEKTKTAPPSKEGNVHEDHDDDKEKEAMKEKEKQEAEKEKQEKEKQEKDKEKQQEKEKQEQKEKQQEKAKEEKAEVEKEKAKTGLVSFTNGTGSYKGMPRDFVDGHNKVRARYGVPPLKWDNKLARHARRWSNAMRKDCKPKHSTGDYGESVFTSKLSTGWNATAKDAIWFWSTEEPIYDKLTGKCTGGRPFDDCGHFALIVSTKNHKIGCGRAECYKGAVFITCNYSSH